MEVYLASAGTGKTHALVERYLEALRLHPPYRLAAVTFTRAAAAELTLRIRERLLALEKTDDPLAPQARAYAEMIPAAPIGTIHAFFAELLRLAAPWLELDPEFLRIEADEAALLFDEEARSYLFETLGHPDPDALGDLISLYARRSLARRLLPAGTISRHRGRLFQAVWERFWTRLGGEVLGPTEIELAADRLLDLAEGDPELAGRLRARLAWIFVDEYQDTSPLQGRVFERLEGLGVRLLVVGDPKQAIYAFRNADVEVFRRAQRRAERVHYLGTSYRHARALVAFLNRFTRELASRGLGFTPDEAPKVRARPGAPEGRVEALKVEGPRPLADLRRAEAREVARWLWERHEAGRKWSEMAVLVRSRTSYEALKPALLAEDVPHVFVGARGFFRLREIRDLVQAARAALDPGDRLALGAFLRGPFGGLSLGEVAAVLRAEDPLAALSAWPHVKARLLALAERARMLEPVRFFEELARARLIEGSSYLELLEPRARANVDRLLFLLASKRFSRLELLLRELEELRALDAEAEVAEGGFDAVRVYTFHGAKGLEWPVVAVFDLARGERRERERVYVAPGEGRYAFMGDPAYPEFEASWKAREEDEFHRLLYVAFSRPREALLFSYSVSMRKTGEGPRPQPRGLARVLEVLGVMDWPELRARKLWIEKSPSVLSAHDDRAPAAPDPALSRSIEPGPWPPVTSPTALKAERLEPSYADPEAIYAEPDPLGRGLGRVVGTLVHAAIAAGWGPERVDWLLRQEAAQHLTEEERRQVREAILELLRAYGDLLGGPLPSLEARERDHAELPFVYPLGRTVIHGVIDRLYRVGGAWFLEDYKTDRVEGDLLAYAKAQGYDFQLAVYRQAVEAALGVRPRVRLVFLARKEVLELSEDLLEAALTRFELG